MTLLGYHLIVCTVVCYQDGDLQFADQILQTQLKVSVIMGVIGQQFSMYCSLQIYPNGLWFLFFKGRLEFMKGNLEQAVTW